MKLAADFIWFWENMMRMFIFRSQTLIAGCAMLANEQFETLLRSRGDRVFFLKRNI